MITDFVLQIPALLMSVILSLLPSGQMLPTAWVQAVYTIWADINAFSFIVPVQTLLTVLAIAMTFHVAILTFRIFHWLITKIPTIGS